MLGGQPKDVSILNTIKQTPIAVIGAGSWGTALAMVLARNQQPVRLWGHEADEMQKMRATRVNQKYLPDFELPAALTIALSLEEVLQEVSDVLIVVPSHAFRSVLAKAKPLFPKTVRIAWGSKGLDPESCLTLDEVAKELLGEIPLAVLSGPSFAKEVAAELPTAVTLASNDDKFSEDLISRFQSETFRLYKSQDLLGVELCGVYKNVLAIAAGMSDGLNLGADARSALITRGIAELSRLITHCGGSKETLLGLAGIGDTILTCTTDTSRNRRFGLLIGGGLDKDAAIKQIGQVVEGYINTQQLHRLAQKHQVEMPIAAEVYRVLYENQSPQAAAKELLMRGGSKWE